MKDKIITLLKKLVSVNSIYPNEKLLAEFVMNFIKSQSSDNITIKKQLVEKNRFNILVEKGNAKKSILFYSHLDTVNSVNKKWLYDPFKLTIVKDNGYGLGSFDMKGGMAVNILTFLYYQPKNFKLKLAFVVDEENISKGGYNLLKSNFLNDVECILSPEPDFYFNGRGITIGRSGRAVYEGKITFKSLHYALYEPKRDINYLLADFIKNLKKLYKIKNKKKEFIFIKKINAESKGMSLLDEIYFEIDSCVIYPNNHETIYKKLLNIAKKISEKYQQEIKIEIKFKKRETPFLESYEINKNNKYLQKLSNSVKLVYKENPILYFRSSVADDNIFGFNKKTVLGIGPSGENAHSENEFVKISSLIKLYKIYLSFLKKCEKNL